LFVRFAVGSLISGRAVQRKLEDEGHPVGNSGIIEKIRPRILSPLEREIVETEWRRTAVYAEGDRNPLQAKNRGKNQS
jgi:hypothetical protein